MPKPIVRFLIRWIVSVMGLFIAANLLSNNIHFSSFVAIIIAGFVLAIINTILKPVLVVLSLPLILVSLGLFMIIINGVCVYIASKLYTPLHITNFLAAIFAGMVIGLVNYLVSAIIER